MLFCMGGAFAAPPALPRSKESSERITKNQLLAKDQLLLYTALKPCWLDKHKYFCCPVRKIVRRKNSESRWTDYCYNSRDELIGIKRNSRQRSGNHSDFSAVPGCSLCGNTKIRQKSWSRSSQPKVIVPKPKKRR
jgi:hypothetical protein